MRTSSTPYIALIYGVFVTLLGYLGWRGAGSMASLFMGGGFGILTTISSFFMAKGRGWADWSTLSIVAILLITFGVRFYLTHSFMPAVMTILSALVLVLLLIKIFRKELTE